MDLHVALAGKGDLARRIHREIRARILEGQLRRGERLPSTRALALRLGVSRNTVLVAYEWLAAQGLISGRRGGGSVVQGEPIRRPPRRSGVGPSPRAIWRSIASPPPRPAPPPFHFGVGVPDVALFPFDAWRRRFARHLRRPGIDSEYGDPAGHPGLRAAIARYVDVSRGVSASPDDVFVTSGAQGAFDLLARVLLEPGMRVAVEEPGYPPLRLLLHSHGARIAGVPVDAEGLDVRALPENARLVCVTPAHQFPLGLPMSHARRVSLLEWAERRKAVVVEDDYDSEFRFGGRPLETLHAMDRGGRVVYVGTFSKSLLPALRLGFLVAPPSLRAALRAASYVATWYPQWPAQACLASLVEEGMLARHVARMRREYAARHERVQKILEAEFADWLEPVPSVTGMHIATRLLRGGTRLEGELATRARLRGVGFDRLSAYYASGSRGAGVVLGYGAISLDRIEPGLRRLRECLGS